MKQHSQNKSEIPVVDHVKPDGSNWTIKEKLMLGLSFQDYKSQFFFYGPVASIKGYINETEYFS